MDTILEFTVEGVIHHPTNKYSDSDIMEIITKALEEHDLSFGGGITLIEEEENEENKKV